MSNYSNLRWSLVCISLSVMMGLGQAKAASPQSIVNVSYDRLKLLVGCLLAMS
jgi:hypothetical protein